MSGFAVQLRDICVLDVKTPTTNNNISSICGTCKDRCEYKEIVFASDNDSPIEKDFSDFLFQKLSNSDTITFELYRNSVKVADIINNTVHGTYYNGFTNQPLYVGLLLDWTKIFNLYSGGTYQLIANLNILGNQSTFESRFFYLYKYDAQIAHRTVKIESYQTGNIIGSEFDYTDLLSEGWYSSTRVKGTFGEKAFPKEVDSYLNTSYIQVQNREQIIPEYTFRVDFVPNSIATIVNQQQSLANEIFITNTDLDESVNYILLPVTIETIETEPFNFGLYRYILTCKDRQQDLIKRNV